MPFKNALTQSLLSTLQQLGLGKPKRVVLSLLLFVGAIFLVRYIGGSKQMEDELNWGFAVAIAALSMIALLFLFNFCF